MAKRRKRTPLPIHHQQRVLEAEHDWQTAAKAWLLLDITEANTPEARQAMDATYQAWREVRTLDTLFSTQNIIVLTESERWMPREIALQQEDDNYWYGYPIDLAVGDEPMKWSKHYYRLLHADDWFTRSAAYEASKE